MHPGVIAEQACARAGTQTFRVGGILEQVTHGFLKLPAVAEGRHFATRLEVPRQVATLIDAGLTPVFEQIDIRNKIDLLKHYGSQIRQDWLESLKAYAYNPRDNSYVERYWALRQ